MSYIKVNIGGKERGLKFNQMALEIFVKHINLDLTALQNAPNASQTCAVAYAGLIANCYVKREEFVDETGKQIDFETVCDWVDDLTMEEKNVIENAFAETQKYKDWLAAFNERLQQVLQTVDGDKKKVEENVILTSS